MSNTQKTTNLFQSVKSFINNKKPGERFTTRELTNAMNGIEYFTRWKLSNKNPFYRTHTYKTYLKRLGFIEMIKRGEWKVIANIPEWLDSGHINFVLFEGQYPNRNMSSIREYKGETEDGTKIVYGQKAPKELIETLEKEQPIKKEKEMKKLTPDKNAKPTKVPLLPSDFDIKKVDKSLEEYKKKEKVIEQARKNSFS